VGLPWSLTRKTVKNHIVLQVLKTQVTHALISLATPGLFQKISSQTITTALWSF